MTQIMPTHVVDHEIDELRRKLEEIRGLPLIDGTVACMEDFLVRLQRIRDSGAASMDDLLDRSEAMEWSGLGRDALDPYSIGGSYSTKRWRRGDLPIKPPSARGDRTGSINPKGGEKSLPDAAAAEAPAETREARLNAALAESRKAA